jgi:hypothetical protein
VGHTKTQAKGVQSVTAATGIFNDLVCEIVGCRDHTHDRRRHLRSRAEQSMSMLDRCICRHLKRKVILTSCMETEIMVAAILPGATS